MFAGNGPAYALGLMDAEREAKGLATEVLRAYFSGYEENMTLPMRALKLILLLRHPRVEAYRAELKGKGKISEKSLEKRIGK